MIFTPRITAAVGLIILAAVLLQLAFFSQVPLLGSVANFVPVVVVALGLLGGALPGVVCGFIAGLLIDSALGTTIGVTSLSLMAAGYLAGRWRESYDIVSSLVPPLLTGALTGVAAATYAAIQLMLGVDAPVSLLVLREIVVQAFLGTLLAVPTFPLIRRVLRSALVDDARPSRRRPSRGMLGVTA
ncbi:MAG TPA: rod shape-determining protein MreD [Solirubrobacterales bacterium]|nr:rod shape-determining protein MreD [Solirubrobacterales bacterium]